MGKTIALSAAILGCVCLAANAHEGNTEHLSGYLIIPTGERVDPSYNAGFSMYVAVWPLVSAYPGHEFQTGLPGTWMFAQYDGTKPKDLYSDVEGGLGWWRDTRFPTETPKFIMGGVGPNFSEIANGPSHGAGDWSNPRGLYGVAQLSPWLLFPIDGLNLKQGTCGELFGYGYLNLPLCNPKSTTDGKDMPTGGNCWTLFISANNFKGPVAFFTPYFWSHCAVKDPRLAGQLLDSRPMDPNMAIQMETQYIPCRIATTGNGDSYARIATTSFPRNANSESALVVDPTAYNRSALYDSVAAWFHGGPPCAGSIDVKGSFPRTFSGKGYATWEIQTPTASEKDRSTPIDWNALGSPITPQSTTYGYRWTGLTDTKPVPGHSSLASLPEYYRLVKAAWKPVPASEVPEETGLQQLRWNRPTEQPQDPYLTPTDRNSCWKSPGPKAGPFKAHLGDGTVVTYCWYRFADQPALLNAGLTAAERDEIQKRVELLHRTWKRNRNYLAPPRFGRLADIDPALIVTPPKGLEIGYVPIAVRQELEKR